MSVRCAGMELIMLVILFSGLWLLGGLAVAEGEMTWVDAHTLTVEGQGWTETEAPWDRLPAKAQGVVRDVVWQLGKETAGICVRFQTSATTLRVRWEVGPNLAMPHMPATGVSGVDLYAKTDTGWRFVNNGRPGSQVNEAAFTPGQAPELCLYLPLYNVTKSVQIGIPAGESITPAPVRGKPIVFYGTSITQGEIGRASCRERV